MTSMKEQNEVLYYKVCALFSTLHSLTSPAKSARDARCRILMFAFFAHLLVDTRASQRDVQYHLYTYGR